jgi:branched-chain amino acid transport system substrate-binding protein
MQLADSLGLVTALKNAGVNLKSSFVQGGYGQALLENAPALSAAQGLTVAAGYAPWSLDLPGVKKMKDALKTYAGWDKPYPAAGFQWGWFTADTAITGLKAAGAKPTGESFVKALRTVTSDNHNGLTCPVDYSKFGAYSQQFPGNCTWMVKVTGKEFVSVTGNDPVKIVLIPGTKNS